MEYIGQARLLLDANLTAIGSWDCTLNESHSLKNDITDHAVEEGGNVSDHIRTRPLGLTMDVVVSDTPLASQDGTVIAGNAPGRARAVYSRLEQLAAGQVFTVMTAIKVYESMSLESMDIPRNAQTGESLRFSLTFKQIRIVRTKVVSLPKTKTPRAKGSHKIGKQVPASGGVLASVFEPDGVDSRAFHGAERIRSVASPIKPSENSRTRRAARAAKGR